MRILGVTEKWPKLKRPRWTTFRLPRRDKDWQVGELVQVVYKPRSKQREVLGIAKIIGKEPRQLFNVTRGVKLVSPIEAKEDGFSSIWEMRFWMEKAHDRRILNEPLNKLTLAWINENGTRPVFDRHGNRFRNIGAYIDADT